jgi:hypothetical protein
MYMYTKVRSLLVEPWHMCYLFCQSCHVLLFKWQLGFRVTVDNIPLYRFHQIHRNYMTNCKMMNNVLKLPSNESHGVYNRLTQVVTLVMVSCKVL